MKQLNRKNYEEITGSPVKLHPERVIQFGEGNFLRAFIDWMIHKANQAGVYDGSVVVVQPIASGLVPVLNEQDGLYTLVIRGLENNTKVVQQEVISSINRGLRAIEDWDQVLACAENPELDVLVSNTTESGIVYSATDKLEQTPPVSFPGKVTAYLYRRFKTFNGASDKGMLLLPCELIDRNGDALKEIVLRYAKEWNLGDNFINWVNTANTFANTLVDRIVTGYPGKEQADAINQAAGYVDNLVNTSEVFSLLVIEAPQAAAEKFPIHKAGLQVKWVDDMTAYRTRKVRILNGAHTSTFALAYLAGFDHVKEAVEDDVVGKYTRATIFDEIIPTVDMSHDELVSFADSVIERFRNPFIKHRWLDISLNAVSKYKARVLPSLLAYLDQGTTPNSLSLSLAALIAFYKGSSLSEQGMICNRNNENYTVKDDRYVLEFFHELWQSAEGNYQAIAEQVLANKNFWGLDLTKYESLVERVTADLEIICTQGAQTAIQNALLRSVAHVQIHKN